MGNAGLEKRLGFPRIVALGAAGVVGSSWIYTASPFFAKYGAGGVIFGLVVGTVLAVCVALAYAELVALLPRAGGEVVFADTAFGRPLAFVAGWLLLGGYVSTLAFYVAATGALFAHVMPAIETVPLYTVLGATVHLPVLAVGVAVALAIWLTVRRSIALAAGFQLALLAAMVAIAVLLTVTGFITGSATNFWPPFAASVEPVAATVNFVPLAIAYLSGLSLVAMMAEDADLTPRRIAWATVATVLVAGGFYVTVLTATAWLIPWQHTAAMRFGVIDAFRSAGYPWLAWGAFIIAVTGLFTSFLALFAAASRLILALARAGLMPRRLTGLNRWHEPGNALTLTLALAIGLGLLGQGALVAFLHTVGIYVGLAWTITIACLYRLRGRWPSGSRPFRVRPGWLPAVGGIATSATLLVALVPGAPTSLSWPQGYLILVGWTLLGLVTYQFARQSPT